MRINLIALTAMALFFWGCKGQTTKNGKEEVHVATTVNGSWQLADLINDQNTADTTGDDLLKAAAVKDEIQKGYIISFFPDGKFTEMKGSGAYRTGSWEPGNNGKVIILKDSVTTETAFIQLEVLNDKQALTLMFPERRVKMKFVLVGEALKNYHEDPFYPANNDWRIKPLHAEDVVALNERLAGYFRHNLYILKAAKERKSEVVSFSFSQGVIKIYNGGIGIQPLQNVPDSWANTYYNSLDALKAYRLFDGYLKHSQYRGAGTGDWIDDDYNILLGIYADFKKMNKEGGDKK